MATQEVALRKRQQIAKANRNMFAWVACVSVLVGFSIVVSIFLAQKALFNEKVLSEKSRTASTLVKNNLAIEPLKDEIRLLNTNENLKSVSSLVDGQPIQVVLDALPSEANSSALGSSLQEKFLNSSALRIESLNVEPIAGFEVRSDEDVENALGDESMTENSINFSFSVSVASKKIDVLKDLLMKLERSIRVMNITNLTIETQGDRVVLTVDGEAYYEIAKTVDLKDKIIKP